MIGTRIEMPVSFPLSSGMTCPTALAAPEKTVFITDSIPDSVTKEVLHIPDTYTRVCITPVGIPVEWPESSPKKALDQFIALEAL